MSWTARADSTGGRARGIIERLTGVTLGTAQVTVLEVGGAVCGLASGILHGRAAGPAMP